MVVITTGGFMKVRDFVLGATVLLCACNGPNESSQNGSSESSQNGSSESSQNGSSESSQVSDVQLKVYAMGEVQKLLRDPDSAEFNDAYVSRKAGVPAICGTVNSKNGFGGMTGAQRYISGGATVVEEQMAPGEMDAAWAKLC
jgi:hypothetical protein